MGTQSAPRRAVASEPAASWCKWVPMPSQGYVADCQGYNGTNTASNVGSSGCVSWCRWVPEGAWQYPADCQSCMIGDRKPSQLPAGAQVPAAAWCHFVSASDRHLVPDCKDQSDSSGPVQVGIDGCADWCKWVPRPAWQYPADCQQCGSESPPANTVVPQPEVPSWCRWVPSSAKQYVADCANSGSGPENVGASGLCEDWCQWVPAPAWQYESGCAGCRNTQSAPRRAVASEPA